MIVVMSRIRVTSSNADAVADQYRQRSHLVEEVAGCLGVEILRHEGQSDEFVVYSRWEDKAAYDEYRKHPAFRQAHGNIRNIAGGVRIDTSTRAVEVYQVLS